MIEIFVNFKSSTESPEWHEVVLPDDFEPTMIEENAEITNNGEFTLDITSSLLESKNVIAFKFLNRLNINSINKTADALLRRNGASHFGTLVVLKNSDIDVTYQFIAGNSELNYNIKADSKKIWELPWGSAPVITSAIAMQSIGYIGYGLFDNYHGNPGYQNNFVCTPVSIGGKIYNNCTVNENSTNVPSSITGITDIIMQPYLLYYINKFAELMGYTLLDNILNSDARAKVMYFLNSVDSLNYADALPDWTIAEFVTNIEEFFNVSFLIDKINKTLSIESLESNMAKKKTVVIDRVLDSYERNLSEDSKTERFDFTRVIYATGDSTYFKYQQLSDSVLEKCTIVDYVNLAAITTALWNSTETNKMIIHRDLEMGNDYFYGAPTINMYTVKCGTSTYLNLINKFTTNGTEDKILELNIIPAEMMVQKRDVLWYNFSGQEFHFPWLSYQLPKCSNSYYKGSDQGFVDNVEKGVKTVSRQSNMEVALYTGKLLMYTQTDAVNNVPQINYPFSHVDYYPEYGDFRDLGDRYQIFESWRNNCFSPMATTTMRLHGIGGVVPEYRQQSILETDKEYSFTIPDNSDVSANNIFIIRNLKYMPISLERKGSSKSNTVDGKFYRML